MTNYNICATCIHAEVCKWCNSITQDACIHYEFDRVMTDVLQEIRQEITNEAYTKQCFDSDMYDYKDKVIDLDDVYAIIDEHIKEYTDE